MTGEDYQAFASFMRMVSQVTAIPNGKSVDGMIEELIIKLEEYPLDIVKTA